MWVKRLKENFFVAERKRNLGNLEAQLKTSTDHKKTLIQFGAKTGLTQKKLTEYYETLVRQGRVREQEGATE